MGLAKIKTLTKDSSSLFQLYFFLELTIYIRTLNTLATEPINTQHIFVSEDNQVYTSSLLVFKTFY